METVDEVAAGVEQDVAPGEASPGAISVMDIEQADGPDSPAPPLGDTIDQPLGPLGESTGGGDFFLTPADVDAPRSGFDIEKILSNQGSRRGSQASAGRGSARAGSTAGSAIRGTAEQPDRLL